MRLRIIFVSKKVIFGVKLGGERGGFKIEGKLYRSIQENLPVLLYTVTFEAGSVMSLISRL